MIHQDLPHHLGRDAEEMGAVSVIRLGFDPPDACRLRAQGGGLQRVVGAFAAQVTIGEAAQFRVRDRHQLIKRLFIAGLHFVEQKCERRRVHVSRF
jgi:hypothetical protein